MTLIGKKARNHPQQVRRDGVDDTIDDRRTPGKVFLPLHEEFMFTIDVAASASNAKLPRFYTREDDGLAQRWEHERVWCNPPFSAIEPWVAKAWQEMHAGCACVVMLLPANRTEQSWWQVWVERFRDGAPVACRSCGLGIVLRTRFLATRIRFGRPPGTPVPKKGDRPPFGLVVLTWTRL